MNHLYQDINGWTDPDLIRVYREAVEEAPSDRQSCCVEVGSYLGRSAAFFLVEIINSGKPILFTCVDHFRGSPDEQNHLEEAKTHGGSLRSAFDKNLEPVSHYAGFSVIQNESVEAAKEFGVHAAELVFIDAAHSETAVYSDLAAWWPVVKTGGVIAGHDADYEGVDKAIRRFFGEVGREIERVGTKCWRVRK